MSGRTIVITGASSGVGEHAARTLADRGEHVVVVGRNPERTEAVAKSIGSPFYLADFSVLDDVRALADRLLADLPRINVLANNAGGLMQEHRVTEDGFEQTLQTNHLASFLLTNLLLDRLKESRASVVTTASLAHRTAKLNLKNLNLDGSWTSWRSYANSKLCNILFTRELHRRHRPSGLSAVCFHPGVVASGFASDSHGPMRLAYGTSVGRRLMTSSEAASKNLVFLAEGYPLIDWRPGGYYATVLRRIRERTPSKAARDPKLATRLWDVSARMVGL